MRILPINNYKQNTTFTAKKISADEINLKQIRLEAAERVKQIEQSIKNYEAVHGAGSYWKDQNKMIEAISDYIDRESVVTPEIMNRPFGPTGGSWPHER